MQMDDGCSSVPQREETILNSLDSALHELGMLGTVTNARHEYLQEMKTKRSTNVLRINSRYVTNVSIGYRLKPIGVNNRSKPYYIPRPPREERPRTRSENADAPPAGLNLAPIIENMIDVAIDIAKTKVPLLKKSKSLENVHVENANASQPSHEMEFVSSRIQRLKMNE